MKQNPAPAALSALELRKKITVAEAAELNGLSLATFRRHHKHLIRKISIRRTAVELGDAINLPPPKPKRS
jgi:hypothetical protein